MKNNKTIVIILLIGVLTSFMICDNAGGSVPGNIPTTVYAATVESEENIYDVSEGCFTDVGAGAYYYRPVYWALENNITTGTSETTFSPGANCTRGQTVTFLWRMAGAPEPENMNTGFVDVSSGSFYEKAIAWALENNITKGKSATTFDPHGICTRSEFVTFLYRAAQTPEVNSTDSKFADVDAGSYYEKPVAWAVENGITTGTGINTFSPKEVCTRGQVVTFLHRWKTTLNILECGVTPDDATDDTNAFNAAFDRVLEEEGVERLYVPTGTYVVNAETGIVLKSNVTLAMAADAILDVTGNAKDHYDVMLINGVENVSISGGQIRGERYKHTGSDGEWGMGIGIYDSSNISLSNMKISSNWGDGIYLGTMNYSDTLYGCDGVRIDNCIIDDNRRSNISIVDADNVTIHGCTISNANGTAPQCGINIEPNRDDSGVIPADAICKNITVTNTTVNVLGKGDYWGQYFCFMTMNYPDNSIITSDNINISGCTFNGDCGNYSGSNATISDTVINGTFYDEQRTKLENVQYEDIWIN